MAEQQVTSECSFTSGDRVKRISTEGPFGTVKKIRVETVRQSIKTEGGEPPGVTVTVLWDNGTLSHFIPASLEKA